jgi:hypothetical protein
MAGRLHDERLVDDDRGILETGVQVAVRPFVGRGSHRQRAIASGGEILFGPLQRLKLWPGRRATGPGSGRRRRIPHVAFSSPVGAGRPEAFDRIGDEWQRLEPDVDPLDRLDGRQLVDRRDGEDRLALIKRLVSQRSLGAAQVGQIIGGENRFDAWHRQRRAGIDADDARVRHRAEE